MEKQIRNEMAHLMADIMKKQNKGKELKEEIINDKKKLEALALAYYTQGKEEQEINLYDKVTVISDDDSEERNDGLNYIGESGTVIEIDVDYEFPLDIDFDNKELNKAGWLWKVEEVKFKEGEW